MPFKCPCRRRFTIKNGNQRERRNKISGKEIHAEHRAEPVWVKRHRQIKTRKGERHINSSTKGAERFILCALAYNPLCFRLALKELPMMTVRNEPNRCINGKTTVKNVGLRKSVFWKQELVKMRSRHIKVEGQPSDRAYAKSTHPQALVSSQ